jgi:hypothetical protein
MTWEEEAELITQAASEYGIDPRFIGAIRKAENGKPGKEFGVLLAGVNTYKSQLDVTCKTIRTLLLTYTVNPFVAGKCALGFRRLVYSPQFIAKFASRWAPIGAKNDPQNLNSNWVRNVTVWYSEFVEQGL